MATREISATSNQPLPVGCNLWFYGLNLLQRGLGTYVLVVAVLVVAVLVVVLGPE